MATARMRLGVGAGDLRGGAGEAGARDGEVKARAEAGARKVIFPRKIIPGNHFEFFLGFFEFVLSFFELFLSFFEFFLVGGSCSKSLLLSYFLSLFWVFLNYFWVFLNYFWVFLSFL